MGLDEGQKAMFSLSIVASKLREDDPLFDQLPDADKRRIAMDLIAQLGADPDDLLTVALVIAPPEARRVAGEVAGLHTDVVPIVRKAQTLPLIARYMLATRLTDGQTAAVLEMSRPTINLWKNGHVPERLTPTQRKALLDTAQRQVAAIEAVLCELVSDEQAVA